VVKSLSYSTLLQALKHTSSIDDKGEYIVVKTEGNPNYYWGNFILFKDSNINLAPNQLESLFHKEFSNMPLQHCAFAWDSIIGNEDFVAEFVSQGYKFEWDEVLVTSFPNKPVNYNQDYTYRIITDISEWEKVKNLHMKCYCPNSSLEERIYVNKLVDDIEFIVKENLGVWMGAFKGENLIGDMGLFKTDNQTGLIQFVKTDIQYRKLGVCRSLLYNLINLGLETFGMRDFVMVADKSKNSARIYKTVGFNVKEYGGSLIKCY